MNRIIEIKTIINNCFISMEDYAQSAHLYFTKPELINDSDEIRWSLLSFTEYVDEVAELIEKYEQEYDNLLKEEKADNGQINHMELFVLSIESNNCLRKLKTCAQNAYEWFEDSSHNEKEELLDDLLEVPKVIDMIKKTLDKLEVIYETEMEGYCYE